MQTLFSLLRYNAWANGRILPLLNQLTPEQFSAPVEGMFGSVHDTANHLVGVERVYLQMLSDQPAQRPPGFPVEALVPAAAEIGAGYQDLLARFDEAALNATFRVPWFEREFTRRDGLLQVVTHSTEHRADLAAALTRFGITTPPIDYVVYVIDSGL
jgi:uncharacterized damage-inducible protein DinB